MFWAVVGGGVYVIGVGAVVSRWVAGRFHVKHSCLGWTIVAELSAGAILLAVRGPDRLEAAAAIIMLPVLGALAVIDVGVRRLPDRLTAGAALGALIGLGCLILAEQDDAGQRWGHVLLGVFLSIGIHGALTLASGGRGMGLGDLKLAPSLAVLPSWLGWEQWFVAGVAPFLLGGIWGLVLILKGEGRSATMPFGPFMIAGWYLAILGG